MSSRALVKRTGTGRFRYGWIALTALALVLAACGSPEGDADTDVVDEDPAADAGEDEADDTTEEPAASTDPIRVEVALTAPDVESNRAWAMPRGDKVQVDPVLETLIQLDVDSGAPNVPGLAEDWEVSDDFREWRFFLRQGVQFHGGWGEFTAADVVQSHAFQLRDDSITADQERWRSADVTAVSDYEVLFAFDDPQPEADLLFSNALAELYIYSSAQYDAEGDDGFDNFAGTGFFSFAERVQNESVRYEAWDEHWSGERAGFDELVIYFVPEDATKLAMLLSGEAQIAEMSPDVQAQAEGSGMQIITSQAPSMQTHINYFGDYYNEEHGQFRDDSIPYTQDIRVRQALNKAINRQEIIDTLYSGRADLVYRSGFLPHYAGWNDEWVERYDEMYGYDPELAVELLAEAGFEPGDLNMGIYSYQLGGQPETPIVAEILFGYFTAIGMNAYIIEEDYSSASDRWRSFEAIEAIAITRNSPIRPIESFSRSFHYSKQPGTPAYFSDERDVLLDALINASGEDARDEAAREVGNYDFENFVQIPMISKFKEMVVNPEFISDWRFPGNTGVGSTHWHLIEPVR